MGLIAKDSGGGDFTPAPEGTHVARCYRIIDLGTQHSERWDSWAHKVLLTWELPDAKMEDGQPFSITKKYTLSLGAKANLRKDLQSWRGRPFTDEELGGFDLKAVAGMPCLLNIVHVAVQDKVYANIAAIMRLPKGMVCPEQINATVIYDIAERKDGAFESFSDRLREIILASKEWQAQNNNQSQATVAQEPYEDDIPF